MNPAALIYALQILNAIPQLIASGQNVVAMVQSSRDALENMMNEKRDPTDAEWNALNAVTTSLRQQLHS